jgi:hypothetical protein
MRLPKAGLQVPTALLPLGAEGVHGLAVAAGNVVGEGHGAASKSRMARSVSAHPWQT